MADNVQISVTMLLNRIREGDIAARNELLSLVNEELYAIARHLMQGERRGHTYTPTALAHEAVVRLINEAALQDAVNRAHFFGMLARSMRQILVRHAIERKRHCLGDFKRHSLDGMIEHLAALGITDVVRFDELLQELGEINERQQRVIELRFFLEMGVKETAALLGVKERTVESETAVARGWLYKRLTEAPKDES
jgi:RNA polymerase sigma factor (TIGR02999 family)